jgi:hypothetical protein
VDYLAKAKGRIPGIAKKASPHVLLGGRGALALDHGDQIKFSYAPVQSVYKRRHRRGEAISSLFPVTGHIPDLTDGDNT